MPCGCNGPHSASPKRRPKQSSMYLTTIFPVLERYARPPFDGVQGGTEILGSYSILENRSNPIVRVSQALNNTVKSQILRVPLGTRSFMRHKGNA